MPARFAPWTPATGSCADSAPAGSRALMRAILDRWDDRRASSWGILSCRPTALGNLSAHSKGRALDVGCSLRVGRQVLALGRAAKVGDGLRGVGGVGSAASHAGVLRYACTL